MNGNHIMKRTAIVTGTSSGIGLETAIALSAAGFNVIATMRNLARREPLDARALSAGVVLDVRELDVTSQSSIAGCVAAVLEQFARIDVLVNNAGAGYLGALEQTSDATLQHMMDVNFFGVWRLTQAVLPSCGVLDQGESSA